MTWLVLVVLLPVLRFAVPYLAAAIGGAFSERSGVINIGLEGFLLVGAFGAAVGTAAAGPAIGALCGVGAGVLLAALYALCVVRLRADQIVARCSVQASPARVTARERQARNAY